MYLPPDIYNIVVTSPGYLPVCQEVEAQFFEAYTADEVFVLHPVSVDPVESGTLRVSVSGLSETTEALISIRQEADCGSGNIKIEVEVLPVANDTDNDFLLPIGPYQIVTSADGKETQVDNVDVAVTGTELNIQF
jgi:hypothetical protein